MHALQSEIDDVSTQSLDVVVQSLRAVEISDIVKLYEESVRCGLFFHTYLENLTKEVDDYKAAHHGETPMGLLLNSLKIDACSRLCIARGLKRTNYTNLRTRWTSAHLSTHRDAIVSFSDVMACVRTSNGFPFIASCSHRVCFDTKCKA